MIGGSLLQNHPRHAPSPNWSSMSPGKMNHRVPWHATVFISESHPTLTAFSFIIPKSLIAGHICKHFQVIFTECKSRKTCLASSPFSESSTTFPSLLQKIKFTNLRFIRKEKGLMRNSNPPPREICYQRWQLFNCRYSSASAWWHYSSYDFSCEQ